ncbi:hypothetical protein K1T35_07635 [Pseudonocardia sp. DSM 110487]|uniref:DUF6879 family protein n=1 Tax=Pseudonocardia sp. DSM 110487 TaxID=2865833 RepID=UPI001C6981DB|nr:DUF6879 family protein [Pseudonocardia sp. DSM 110487]QYN37113.1 hypothetical protein K1T35_07635 [Pseudonocardia sp. DSM 110487]
MSGQTFDSLFESFERTVFRLEALPAYEVGGADAERFQAYHEGRPLSVRSVRTSPWLARIAVSTVTAGKAWSRVRVVDSPLSPYQRYSLEAYRESQAAGEEIFLAPRSAVRDWGPDFWLFDGGTPRARAALMRYSPDGQFHGFEFVEDPEPLAGMEQARLNAVANSVPLNVFLAEDVAGA